MSQSTIEVTTPRGTMPVYIHRPDGMDLGHGWSCTWTRPGSGRRCSGTPSGSPAPATRRSCPICTTRSTRPTVPTPSGWRRAIPRSSRGCARSSPRSATRTCSRTRACSSRRCRTAMTGRGHASASVWEAASGCALPRRSEPTSRRRRFSTPQIWSPTSPTPRISRSTASTRRFTWLRRERQRHSALDDPAAPRAPRGGRRRSRDRNPGRRRARLHDAREGGLRRGGRRAGLGRDAHAAARAAVKPSGFEYLGYDKIVDAVVEASRP